MSLAAVEDVPSNSPGSLFQLIRRGEANTRNSLQDRTGLARSSLAKRLDALLAHGYVRELPGTVSIGGRPPSELAVNTAGGVVVVACLSVSHSRVAVADLNGRALAEAVADVAMEAGPRETLQTVDRHFSQLLGALGFASQDVCGIGIGVPGPVRFDSGHMVAMPLMPGWDGFSISTWLADRYDVPVVVDKDANLMALGEHRTGLRDVDDFVYVKYDAEIRCGVIAGGQLHRGELGAAGDIGHIRVAGQGKAPCRCGNAGCLDAVASGAALALRLGTRGLDARDTRDVVAWVRAGESEAVQAVREGSRQLGEVLAAIVTWFNPETVVVGGALASLDDHVFASLREGLLRSTRSGSADTLSLRRSTLGERAELVGATTQVLERIFAPDAIDRVVRRRPTRQTPHPACPRPDTVARTTAG